MQQWTLANTLEFEGRTVRWDSVGSGPPAVVVHGTPWSSFNLRHVIHGLAASHTVYFFDLLGYGQSDKGEGNVSLGVQNRVLKALLDQWKLDRPVAIGHDFGGATVLRAHLLDGAAFSHLVLVDAVALSPWGSSFFRHVAAHVDAFAGLPAYLHETLVRRYIQTAAHQEMSPWVLDRTVDPWLGTDGQAALYRQMAQADSKYTEEVEPRFDTISTPTLVLWGTEDAWLPVEQGRRLAETIPGARFEEIPDSGHLVIEEQPGALLREIGRFLGH